MKLTTVISAIGYVLLFFPPAGASEKQPVDVKEKKASEETEAAIRRYAARIAVAKIALEHGSGKQARIELSLTNPERAVADAPATRTCVAVALSPDGRQVASAASARSRDEPVEPHLHIWSTMTRRQLDLSDYPKDSRIQCVAFSPDGKFLATGRSKLPGKGGTLRLWNAQTGEALRSIKAHEGGVTSLAFSPQGDRLVTGSDGEESIAVWDVSSGRELLRIQGLDHDPAIAYSPDGKRIVTGDWSQRLRFWDAQTGVQLLALDKQKRVINTIAFSPDGKKIAAGGWDVQATICDSTLDKNTEGPP